jgi:Tol biopolymer transport system component
MRAFTVLLVSIGVVGVLGPAETAASPGRGCNGLLAFASNAAPSVKEGTYAISMDRRRTYLGFGGTVSPSPDGRRLAYAGASGLVVADADGSHARPMLFPKGASLELFDVQWAPDSKRLAVTAASGGGTVGEETVIVFDSRTGVATTLGAGSNPRWSPDGSLVAFHGSLANGEQWVILERPDGTERRQLAPGQSVGAWSPDGRLLLVDNGDTRVVPVAGGDPITIRSFNGLAWTPDGSRIVGTDFGGGTTLESFASNGTDPQVIAHDAFVVGDPLAPDGGRVVFVSLSDGHVLVAGLDGHVLRDFGPWDSGPFDLHMSFKPRWSPDGTKIVFWSGGKIIVADTDTAQLHTLAGGPGLGTGGEPVWSADGSSVFDTITDTSGNTDIYVARPDGKGVRPVFTDRLPEGGPVWSPDGKRLAFIRYGSRPSLIVTDIKGHARILTTLPRDRSLPQPPLSDDGSGWPSPPAWSPDGKTLAVVSNTRILLVDVRTRSINRWKAQTHQAVAVAWSRDGISYTDGFDESDIWTVGKRSTWKTCVCDFSDPNYGNYGELPGLATNLAWSPDGRKLAFLRYGAAMGTGFFALVVDSIQVVDKKTRKTRSIPTNAWGFAWSPDGRYLVQANGYNTEITNVVGKHVAWLRGLNPLDPSWQSLCRIRSGP